MFTQATLKGWQIPKYSLSAFNSLLSFLRLVFVSNSRIQILLRCIVIKYIYRYDLSSIKVLSLSRYNLRSRFKFDHRAFILSVSSTSKAADGKQSNCNFDRNREEEEERLVERSRVPRASARWEGKSRKRIPLPLSCRWRLICRIRWWHLAKALTLISIILHWQSAHGRSMRRQVFDGEHNVRDKVQVKYIKDSVFTETKPTGSWLPFDGNLSTLSMVLFFVGNRWIGFCIWQWSSIQGKG